MTEANETVAIVGALGTQGASVIRALRSSPITSQWKIHALTSSPQSESARALSEQANVSIVYCDVNDPKSIHEAFQGCTHIFANTAFHGGTLFAKGQKAGEDLENAQGMNLVRAAAETKSLKHLIWSTLPDSNVTSQGKWKVPHFMSKQHANEYILGGYTGCDARRQQQEPGWGSLRDKSTLMSIGVYGSNFRNHSYRPTKKHEHDEYVIQLPCSPDVPFSIAGDENENVGILVRAIFEQPETSIGTWISCESERISCRQWVACLDTAAKSQGVRKTITFEECTMQSIEERWGVLGNEIGQMMAYISELEERAFENTSDLPEINASQLGVQAELVPVRVFYEKLDCVALLREVDNGEIHLGTASR
ncbi:hypothetical protein LTR84_004577 [Exophiala bonariae]|uniref:NmrA-like domain-containing protein n=1 Tax=Exophiala bonariae TaxID=1690606 RepID=A0AAV9NQ13_9EURO|nr:hypothetical protein LTR84_004577 [Exophiala bonariae]